MYKITLSDGTEELYDDWDAAFDRWTQADDSTLEVIQPDNDPCVCPLGVEPKPGGVS